MEPTIHTITLDLQRPCKFGALTVKKGDTHRQLRLRLLSGGKPYPITQDCYGVFTAQKPDGTVLYNHCAKEENTLVYLLTPQTTAVAGTLECEIKLYGPSDALLTTAAFTLTVEDTVYTQGEDAVFSAGEATALTQLVTQARDGVDRMEQVLEKVPSYAVLDNTRVAEAAWSAKQTVDKLCPGLEETGRAVTCQPVEGSQLKVEWERKNLVGILETGLYLDNGGAPNEVSGFIRTADYIPVVEGQSYVFSEDGKYASGYVHEYDANKQWLKRTAMSVFTVPAGTHFVKWNSDAAGYTTDDPIQLEIGKKPTTYEPYAETATEITQCGKNLASTDILVGASGITETDGVFSGMVRSFSESTRNIGFVPAKVFEEGQQYVFSLYAKKGTKESTPYTVIKYTDGTQSGENITATGDFERYISVSSPGKTVQGVWLSYGSGGIDTLYIKDVQVEKGTTVTPYEPYNGGTFALGEEITAIYGVNTIFANAGVVTVTGKADPAAVIEKLTNAILALGGNV